MSRTWRYAAITFAALAIIGSAIAVAVVVVVTAHSRSNAIDAHIDATIAADAARDSKVFAEMDADSNAAKTVCENLVREQLKAPVTAQFAVSSNTVGGAEGDLQGLVHGTVDSQNSYGALVRSDWTCMVLPGSTASAMKASITSVVQR